jgi:hypothetical protein
MVDRRSVLKLGAASAMGALVGMPSPALLAVEGSAPSLIHGAVFSARFQPAVYFAEELLRRRVLTFSAADDIAKLWYRDLLGGLSQHRGPIAGLTDRVTLFCLEELARSAGLGVWYRVDHVIDEYGNAEHSAVGPTSVLEAARKLTPKSEFGREMAVLASRFELREPKNTSALKHTGPFSPENKVALVVGDCLER